MYAAPQRLLTGALKNPAVPAPDQIRPSQTAGSAPAASAPATRLAALHASAPLPARNSSTTGNICKRRRKTAKEKFCRVESAPAKSTRPPNAHAPQLHGPAPRQHRPLDSPRYSFFATTGATAGGASRGIAFTSSAASPANSAVATLVRGCITTSQPPAISCRCIRKISRKRRRMRFRFTAFPSAFLMLHPNRLIGSPFWRTNSVNWRLDLRFASRYTASYSARLTIRHSRGRSSRGGSDARESVAPLLAACGKHFLSTCRFHPFAEPMLLMSPSHMGLKSTFRHFESPLSYVPWRAYAFSRSSPLVMLTPARAPTPLPPRTHPHESSSLRDRTLPRQRIPTAHRNLRTAPASDLHHAVAQAFVPVRPRHSWRGRVVPSPIHHPARHVNTAFPNSATPQPHYRSPPTFYMWQLYGRLRPLDRTASHPDCACLP
jgi:hypothetical protein